MVLGVPLYLPVIGRKDQSLFAPKSDSWAPIKYQAQAIRHQPRICEPVQRSGMATGIARQSWP